MIQCPICKGKGRLENPQDYERNNTILKKRASYILKKSGFGIRQIQRLLGYKSPRSIQVILKKER